MKLRAQIQYLKDEYFILEIYCAYLKVLRNSKDQVFGNVEIIHNYKHQTVITDNTVNTH